VTNTPIDVDVFKQVLPYDTEAYGLFQPLIGWRSQRAVDRFQSALANSDERAFTAFSRSIRPDVKINAALEVEGLAAGTLEGPPKYSPLLSSKVADLVYEKVAGRDLSDPDVWASVVNKEYLDQLLNTEVRQGLLEDLDQYGDSTETRMKGFDALAQRESVIAGTLNNLLTSGNTSTLRSLFTRREVMSPRYEGLTSLLNSGLDSGPWSHIGLSPIGVVHLFRQYFFEFDTFLGPPVQHVWLSPGGTVELVEVSTRKTTVERTAEQSIETTTKTDKTTTSQDDLSDAIKKDNEQDTKVGASVTANERWGWGDASETASLNYSTTEKEAREQTHKRMRQQSTSLSSEIKTNFKTTFRTVTETTDTTSRRFVLANETKKLVNYELRRKMRQVGVQVQDLGAQLCWQSYVDDPGGDLLLAKLVHVATPPDFSSLGPVNEFPPPEQYTEEYTASFSFDIGIAGVNSLVHITPGTRAPLCYIPLHPKDGYEYRNEYGEPKWSSSDSFTIALAHNQVDQDGILSAQPPDPPFVLVQATFGSSHVGTALTVTIPITFQPTAALQKAIADKNKELLVKRDQQEDQLVRANFVKNLCDRIRAESRIEPRSFDDLREEERDVLFRKLIKDLFTIGTDLTADKHVLHKAAEMVNSIFDIDALVYFVAPDWWHPVQRTVAETPSEFLDNPALPSESVKSGVFQKFSTAVRRIPGGLDSPISAAGQLASQPRPHDTYDITDESAPARLGASLGWLMQLDGDNHRNAFLNASWVKAVIPIRLGKEIEAIEWISNSSVEGSDGLEDRYVGSSSEEILSLIKGLEAHNWPDGPQQDRYTDFENKVASGVTFVSVRDALTYLTLRIQDIRSKSEEVVSEDLGDGVKLNYLRPDMVYEHGFDPLEGGFRANTGAGQEYEPFTQWVEVLPTDQVVAVQVEYDPATGRQVPVEP
jgi:hypothetical protein